MIDDPEVVTRDVKFYADFGMFGCHFEGTPPLVWSSACAANGEARVKAAVEPG
jgi:hypothetical protein